jgi:hypothetical protein
LRSISLLHMASQNYQDFPVEALMNKLIEETKELLGLIDSKASMIDILAKKKEVEQIQKAISRSDPNIQLR